ncbi:hypothetical protein SAMN05421767_1127 [Granulicatella balaenopterae]|uniref:Metallophosphoesterase n=1 Tax=Granulicatella balaenopterae TaxID=137733 RepID=A0A1H9K6S5_9LACT|nr:TIGR00282 family metallophosphoesterase [Granulicatella balaenopterae]SEQ94821.1 hypothetical protein SAMN05421767_1127 [Granulicatella balaenopterae]
MKVLFIGDVVGNLGRKTISQYVPLLKRKYKPQVTIINGENAANGRGITEKIYKQFLQDGADVVTLGNHAWDNRDIFEFIDDAKKMVRPANFPKGVPGVGVRFVKVNQHELAVINLQGRIFMNTLDDPFQVVDELIKECKERTDNIFVDFHAETTSEKQAMGWFLDGRCSAVIGTHTHVQTNDARILPQGTAFLSDVGMTGPWDGILGMERSAIIGKFLNQLPTRFEVPDEGRTILSACVIDIDEKTGRARKIESFVINEDHPFFEGGL